MKRVSLFFTHLILLAAFNAAGWSFALAGSLKLPDLLWNNDGTDLTMEIFRDAETGAAKTHWIPTLPNMNWRTVDPRSVPVEEFKSVDDFVSVRMGRLPDLSAQGISVGIAYCINLCKPINYAYRDGDFPPHPVFGKDPLSAYVDWCRKKGVMPFFSIRMNDQHHSIYNYPQYHVGRFFWERPELFIENPSKEDWETKYIPWINTGSNSPKALPESYRNRQPDYHDLRLDYTYDEVREYYIGIARDLARDYPDAAGVELDFMRSLRYFPDGAVREDLLTDVVRRIREEFDRIGTEQNRKIFLVARVPTAFDGPGAGVNARAWIEAGYLDGIILGHGNRIAENPMEELASLARQHGVKVYGPIERMYFNTREREPTPMNLRGAAATLYGKGADGLYFFNWFGPEEHYMFADIASSGALEKLDKSFFADEAAVIRGEGAPSANKIRPPLSYRPGEVNKTHRMDLIVNTDLSEATSISLNVVTRNIRRDFLEIRLNGTPVTERMNLVYGLNRLEYWLGTDDVRSLLVNGKNSIDVTVAENPYNEDLILDGVTCDIRY
jgi:hypothetical protein